MSKEKRNREKQLYDLIVDLSSKQTDNRIITSTKRLAVFMGFSVRSVQEYLKSLQSAKLIAKAGKGDELVLSPTFEGEKYEDVENRVKAPIKGDKIFDDSQYKKKEIGRPAPREAEITGPQSFDYWKAKNPDSADFPTPRYIRHHRRISPLAKLIIIEINITRGDAAVDLPFQYFQDLLQATRREVETAFAELYLETLIWITYVADVMVYGTADGLLAQIQDAHFGEDRERYGELMALKDRAIRPDNLKQIPKGFYLPPFVEAFLKEKKKTLDKNVRG